MLFNDPRLFKEEMLDGYTDVYSEYVMKVPGGVVRATKSVNSKVAVVNGGGSGHYPAFCGLIGEGLMDGTAVGNIFTSPSVDDMYNVAKAVDPSNGLLIVGGNYTGDKINFNMARDRLIREGYNVRTFYICDDIASASPEESEKRRGNIGTFTVFKILGAAAAAGYTMDALLLAADKANRMTRSFSIGFRGCTLPGADKPSFHVPEGRMELGQGIHGEPGIREESLGSAAYIAETLVEKVLEEAPENDSHRISVILDGLGSTKYEELFVVWSKVSQMLKTRGYTLVAPIVGEVVTSLDMAGIGLSITFLDEELEKLWLAPADSPGFRRGHSNAAVGERRKLSDNISAASIFSPAAEPAKKAGALICKAFQQINSAMIDAEARLASLDALTGDGDHGRCMVNGSTAAARIATEGAAAGAGAGSILKAAGQAWASSAGGTSGVLLGAAISAAGDFLGDEKEIYSLSLTADAVDAGISRIRELGGAAPGDRTMLDALLPFAEKLKAEAGNPAVDPKTAWNQAVSAGKTAAQETAAMIPRVGRARPMGERSLGTPDPGAISVMMCLEAAFK